MKIFRIVCTLVLWLTLFGTCAAAFFFRPDAGLSLIMGALLGFVMMLAASFFLNDTFD